MNVQKLSLKEWNKIKHHALDELGFSDISATNCDLSDYIPKYQEWVEKGFHADLDYMVKHGSKRYTPQELVEGTKSVITVRLNYLPAPYHFKNIRQKFITANEVAAISVYAHGRDYHKVLRKKLDKLSEFITNLFPSHHARVFTDSAPVLEKPLAEKAGLGWIGKNSNLLNEKDGSFFFLGCIYSNLDFSSFSYPKAYDQCGKCQACIKACPTHAIIDGRIIDAKKCISYLTIENKGIIPIQFRKAIGNRIYGCDDCQLVCPINKKAAVTTEADFQPRHQLDNSKLLDLANWSETTFFNKTKGSAIHRIGYQAWLRNIYTALGNAPFSEEILRILISAKNKYSENKLLIEHINWAISEQSKSRAFFSGYPYPN
ncbi:tRNA epoxyqueuosine(34) reductase QueG [Fastidiosibacter lacustris]|uniref:tRNA epoxyqueuosine(34) reductase QueG n=1 Tax=Fastidiosibacter lacustris TaxID=2056695 RepID=UPI000E355EB1|nr:tRNA epoxyqueuosine(34) reductase QueG [Fastidiosibacter lacustris]